MKRKCLSVLAGLSVLLGASQNSQAQTNAVFGNTGPNSHIAVYFNQPVDTSVATGVKAKYLNNSFADTVVAYINRAKYSIDIAQYDYNQSAGYANIANALNSAYLAGKKVRWIYDSSQSNTGLALLNPGIRTLGSPTTSAYGIMHHKFIVIDANSSNPGDAVVSTGSEDWGITQFNLANNNLLFLQDSALAHAYLAQFNMMWGDTGAIPNTALSKFGPFKSDLGAHTFHIDGKLVELYFSPTDATNTHILSTINSANTDLYFGVFTFTSAADANAIVARQTAGVYVAGITDQNSSTGAAYPILTSGLGSNMKTFTGSGALVYHHKMAIIDPSNACSDPMVLTGSHNWTTSANTKNDENTLIIHSDTIANIYYQAFKAEYEALSGTLTPIAPCVPASCGTPSGLFASAITTSTATLNWAAVSGAVSYTVKYRVSGAGTWDSVTVSVNSAGVSGLSSSTDYEFVVEATCAAATSPYSSAATFTTLAAPCNVPTGQAADSITYTTAFVSWNPDATATGYVVEYRINSTATWSSVTTATDTVTLTGLAPGTNYEYRVASVCASGTGTFSLADTFTTVPAPPCTIPVALSATDITDTMTTISWGTVAGATLYTINYRVLGAGSWNTDTSSFSYKVLTGLVPGTSYEFRVRAECPGTSTAYSGSFIFVTAYNSCPVPYSLTATAVSATSAQLNWSATTGAASYLLRYRKIGTGAWNNSVRTVNSAILTGLTAAISYEFQVNAVCASGDSSGYAALAYFTTLPPVSVSNVAVAAPALLAQPNPTNGNVTVSYTLAETGPIVVAVYDMTGRLLTMAADQDNQPAGAYSYTVALPASGMYYVKLTTATGSSVVKVTRL